MCKCISNKPINIIDLLFIIGEVPIIIFFNFFKGNSLDCVAMEITLFLCDPKQELMYNRIGNKISIKRYLLHYDE